ncbi:uncharacterized protein Bfra_005128 [Botrytis fragariae]|uniref:Uncharacterized protein n=1 Tax=Botrytis fragariae TaxID=1964551 RepID=A0A8H6AUC4_9HELO|nr:uncharacterized protein Bfra_005128 [Botrytis fragariae]KAF5873664.1 hypothetical protein Bfra_005128 [Botrytis fragariae]
MSVSPSNIEIKGLEKNKMVKFIVSIIGITGSIFFHATYPNRLIALSVEWENASNDRILGCHVLILICMQIPLQ